MNRLNFRKPRQERVNPLPPTELTLDADEPLPQSAPELSSRPESREVWIGNPANSHAYKKVRCETREEANSLASSENAHLVTINDEKEQH